MAGAIEKAARAAKVESVAITVNLLVDSCRKIP